MSGTFLLMDVVVKWQVMTKTGPGDIENDPVCCRMCTDRAERRDREAWSQSPWPSVQCQSAPSHHSPTLSTILFKAKQISAPECHHKDTQAASHLN